jgi:hypothetical protein
MQLLTVVATILRVVKPRTGTNNHALASIEHDVGKLIGIVQFNTENPAFACTVSE